MSKSKPFTHLHFHTQYSLLDGACKIGEVMDTARQSGMTAAAITDHGVMYGVIDFYKAARKAGIKPILGCEVYMAPDGTSRHDRKLGESNKQSNHLVLLAEDLEGYYNLSKLVSIGHLEGFYYKPRIDKEILAEHSKGLVCLSACLAGEVAGLCAKREIDQALAKVGEYTDIFGKDNYYLELQDHGLPEQRIANQGILELARRADLPLVVTNDVHYVKPGHHEAHDCMICLQTQSVMSDPTRMQYGSDQFYMKTPEEMWHTWGRDHGQALLNTMAVAERCNVEMPLGIPGRDVELHFPEYEVPAAFRRKQDYLLELSKQGLRRLYGIEDIDHPKNPDEKIISERFYYEFKIICQMNFVNYFLVVWDFINYAKEQGIPVGPGRGSGAGSILAYALGITGLDPLRYGLIFERFLNPERVSMPDFDIDFCQARRGEVIEYVKDKYGRENVAQIVTFGSLGAKTVIRDVGRVLEISFGECDRLAKLIPEEPGMTLTKALDASPDFLKATNEDPAAQQIMKYARVLEGLPRNPGTHAAGVVIGEKPLIEILPLARDKDKQVITQFEMKVLEEVGLLKMDFLGLKTLTVIQETVRHVRETRGIDIDLEKLPEGDPATYALLNRGDTIGVFQVESEGMRDLLRRIALSKLEELIAMIALYRPGPMNMLDDYINRKHGKLDIKYEHPLLEDILKETYGVMIYQEQVQQAAQALAGFSLGEGDMLRRAMGKKKPEIMAEYREKFTKGCYETNKIEAKLANRIFDNIAAFAGYGFNKSHSAAYAVISYQTAYLKANYPAEFMAALLSSEMGNADKLPKFIAEVQEMGIEVQPPDVNESIVRFRPIKGNIRFGLAGVKNVGVGAVEALVVEREANGPFTGLLDFCSRLDSSVVNRKVLESLVTCGAFEFSGESRGRLFNAIDFAMGRAAEAQRDKASGQGSLFDLMDSGNEDRSDVQDELPQCPPWPMSRMLAGEKELLGFYISGHPLKEFEWDLEHYALNSIGELPESEERYDARLGGLVTQYAKLFTKKSKEAMAIFRLEGLDGMLDAVAFPEAFRKFGVHLKEDAPILATGQITREEDRLKMMVDEIYPLSDAHRHFAKRISIHLPRAGIDKERLQELKDIVRNHPGQVPVSICLIFPGGEKVFIQADQQYHATADHSLYKQLVHQLGEETVYIEAERKALKNPRPKKKWEKNQ